MREIQVHRPKTGTRAEAVRRVQFTRDGATLVARVGDVFHAYDLRADKARVLYDELAGWSDYSDEPTELAVSPDARWLVYYYNPNGDGGYVSFIDLANPEAEPEYAAADPVDHVGLAFTADGAELVAVQNYWGDDEYRQDVARFRMAALTDPPKRTRRGRKTHEPPARDLKWKRVMDLPGGEVSTEVATAAALSADGRLLAVGTTEGTVHVADLKRKKGLASFPWRGRKPRNPSAVRVGLDPAGGWVVMLADAGLRGYPLGAGKPWKSSPGLRVALDFAFHPDGRAVCAVFADGHARYLDPATGAVRQSFRWSKKALNSVAFSPDGLLCAAGCTNGKVILWDVDA